MVGALKHNFVFHFAPFSQKQKQILSWWTDASPVRDYDGIIADGAIRSGKTLSMALSFVMWAMYRFNGQNLGMCGKTIGSFRRNVLIWLKIVLWSRGYKLEDRRNDNLLVVQWYDHDNQQEKLNYFYIFGGKDEQSQDLIQGITLAGILFDEVALMPESFVTQGTGRCSVTGSKFWFNCNPDSPSHWFKLSWINKAKQKKLLYLHFTMDDNLSLDEKTKDRYRRMYEGLWFKRFILGLWVLADGAIYDMWDDALLVTDDQLPGQISDFSNHRRYIGVDYGTTNPCVFYDARDDGKILWFVNEYYYDSSTKGRQKTDSEYADDMVKFIGNEPYECIIVDPSAASFKAELRSRGLHVKDADNEVLDGIRTMATMMSLKLIRVHKTKCRYFQQEVTGYIWDEKASDKGKEQPVKQFDHCMDAARYVIKTQIKQWRLERSNAA
jgi:PBSX family phage terminase large subunit